MVRIWIIVVLILTHFTAIAQVDTGAVSKPAPKRVAPVTPAKVKADSSQHKPKPVSNTIKPATVTDTTKRMVDSAALVPKIPQRSQYDITIDSLKKWNTYFKHLDETPVNDISQSRPDQQDDWLVYVVGGILLLLGIFRVSYLKFFGDLFRAFLNPTLSQRQLKDQLSQSPFPNFLLNFFWVITLGFYIYLLMYRLDYINDEIKWMLIPGLMLLVGLIYAVKYVVLRFCGWLFGSADLIDAYVFILYLINKVLGIVLVPFLVILAFCSDDLAKIGLYISLFFIVLMVGYRYVRSYSLVKQHLAFSKLHFFLYLCAFEVVPVLIIIKALLRIVNG
ncbi:uncharacterized protein DUF4271 [Chitinophaga skermanii]|uniref:Uncharacterized protein DUF4271 n=1 Tax=Chitinophaga skermanii TaxID=331697 RepID=A0A327QQ42_9BACT|nr:DUF4271 domain-containing protein [Chitinophaga skermanii]RAJ03897.1 uncharacterized protein DUF4271 [Chitinophaga skermanii]